MATRLPSPLSINAVTSRASGTGDRRRPRVCRSAFTLRDPRAPRTHSQLFPRQKKFSSGVVEGLNNKAKVTMRKAYGFRTFRIAEIALYHAQSPSTTLSATYQSQNSPTHSTDEIYEESRYHDLLPLR
jgi:Transposase